MTVALSANTDGQSGILSVGGSPSISFGADTSGQLAGYRNRIINGDASIAQRGNVAAINNAFVYGGADRTCAALYYFTTASGTIQQFSGVATSSGYAQGITGVTTTGSGNVYFQQRIEALNTADLNSQTVTVSCIVYHNIGSTQNARISIGKPSTTADTFSSRVDLSTSDQIPITSSTPTRITYTTKIGVNEASLGLYVNVFIAAGAISGKNFWVGDLQLEKGSIATPFEFRQRGTELLLCWRYYEYSYPGTYATFFNGAVVSGATYYSIPSKFMGIKKTNPIVTFYNVGASAFPTTVGSVFNNSVFGVQESRTANATANAGIFGSSYTADSEL